MRYEIYFDPAQRPDDAGFRSFAVQPPLDDAVSGQLAETYDQRQVSSRTREDCSTVSVRWPRDPEHIITAVRHMLSEAGHGSEIIVPLPPDLKPSDAQAAMEYLREQYAR